MSFLATIKPFWPLLFTFILPRAIGYYRAFRVALRTRPAPRPLPPATSRGLNALFTSICIYLFVSFPSKGIFRNENIFVTTNSRIQIPTDVLFTRLALARPDGILTASDELLREKMTSSTLRKIYLRFGPSTLMDCIYCQPNDDMTYLLYHLPSNVVLPHLIHFLAIGIATSETISGFSASQWRFHALIGATVLAVFDVFSVAMYTPVVDVNLASPQGHFWSMAMSRPFFFIVFDLGLAFLIYASATGRYLLFPTPGENDADAETLRHRNDEMLAQANVSLQMAQAKLRGVSVARNAVVRNQGLKSVDDRYWRDVVAVEGPENDPALLEDEQVQSAMAKVYGSGTLDIARMRREAEGFVANVTKPLD